MQAHREMGLLVDLSSTNVALLKLRRQPVGWRVTLYKALIEVHKVLNQKIHILSTVGIIQRLH
jgi:hypothetical protein